MSAAPERPLDVRALLATLARHGVEYTVVGGVAVQAHGHRRTTKDLDIIPAPDEDNLRRLAAALEELEARPREVPGATTPSLEQLQAAPVVPPLTTVHGELHVLRDVPGAAQYPDLRRRALVVKLDDLELAIAGLDDVIAMKRAAGRDSDMRDIAFLAQLSP